MRTEKESQTILVVAARGFEEIELTTPVDILRRLGVRVCVAGVGTREVEGAHGMPLITDCLIDDAKGKRWDGILIPGGPAAWDLKQQVTVLQLVQSLYAEGKLVAAICAAPMVLAAAGVVNGRRITCYPAPDVLRAVESAQVEARQTVMDGNLITGRGPAAALDFGYALADYLAGEERTTLLKKEMCYGH